MRGLTALQVFSNSAAALPCEIGADGQPVVQGGRKAARGWTPARSFGAWRQRVAMERAQNQASLFLMLKCTTVAWQSRSYL